MNQDQIAKQVDQILSQKGVGEAEKLSFLAVLTDQVRQEFAACLQKELKEEDFDKLESMKLGNEELLFAEMVKLWEFRTKQTKEDKIKELVLKLLDRFVKIDQQYDKFATDLGKDLN